MSKQKYAVYVGFSTEIVAETEAEAIASAVFGIKYGVDNNRQTSLHVSGVLPYEEPKPEPVQEAPIEVHFPDATSAFGSSDTSDIPF